VLDGYLPLILAGALVTVELAILAVAVAMLLGLASASAALSSRQVARIASMTYTTVVRGIPDLVLMMLLFYSVQQWLNEFTEWAGAASIDIPPFAAGVLTIGFVYGAYFSETFRGAFLAVPRGQIEAAQAIGLGRWRTFRRIVFPQVMRIALPGVGNNFQVLLKSVGLVSLIGIQDMVAIGRQAGLATTRHFVFLAVVGALFLLMTMVSQWALQALERRYTVGIRRAEL